MAAAELIFGEGSTLELMDDGTYGLLEHYAVAGLSESTEVAAKLAAFSACASLPVYSNTKTVGALTLRLVRAGVMILSKSAARVTLQWGINDSPQVDGDWIVETYSEMVREPMGVDVNGDAITVKYQPATMSDGDFASDWNQRRYDRGITVPGFHNRVHIIGRRQISATAAASMPYHPTRWAAAYVGRVNYEIIAGGSGQTTVPEGVMLCSSMRAYTRSRGLTYFVEAEFVQDARGHDPFAVFVDSDGTIPGDITIPDGMKLAWPTERGSGMSKPYGATRPTMVRGRATFANPPVSLNLALYYAS